jgi:hypothetical protein
VQERERGGVKTRKKEERTEEREELLALVSLETEQRSNLDEQLAAIFLSSSTGNSSRSSNRIHLFCKRGESDDRNAASTASLPNSRSACAQDSHE